MMDSTMQSVGRPRRKPGPQLRTGSATPLQPRPVLFSSEDEDLARCVPTPETQNLYNEMRFLEENRCISGPPIMPTVPAVEGTRKRALRHGPLDSFHRARVALMRKVGACANCKARKVKVRNATKNDNFSCANPDLL